MTKNNMDGDPIEEDLKKKQRFQSLEEIDLHYAKENIREAPCNIYPTIEKLFEKIDKLETSFNELVQINQNLAQRLVNLEDEKQKVNTDGSLENTRSNPPN